MKLFFRLYLKIILFQAFFLNPVSAETNLVECHDGDEKVSASIVASDLQYPESPIWIEDRLYFVEFSRNQVSVLKDGKIEVFWARPGCGPAAVTRYQTSGFLVACYDANTVVQLSKMGRVEKVYRSSGTRSFKGPNDFSVDSKEGTYFTASGVFKISAPVEGEIHYLPPQGNLVRVASGIHYSNGIAVISQEGRGPKVLVSEHLKNRILSYAILKNGKLSRTSEVFYDLAKQLPARADSTQGLQGPDGMRLGADGIIYIAQYAASRIIKLRTDGTLVGQISIDSTFRNPTNVWLHDHKLYVSAYRETSSPDSSGIILMIDDPKISSRKNLNCSIRPNGQAE